MWYVFNGQTFSKRVHGYSKELSKRCAASGFVNALSCGGQTFSMLYFPWCEGLERKSCFHSFMKTRVSVCLCSAVLPLTHSYLAKMLLFSLYLCLYAV